MIILDYKLIKPIFNVDGPFSFLNITLQDNLPVMHLLIWDDRPEVQIELKIFSSYAEFDKEGLSYLDSISIDVSAYHYFIKDNPYYLGKVK